MQDKKAAALVALLVALPSLVAAGVKWIEADIAEKLARAKTLELQQTLDNYSEYIVAQLKKGCE